MGKMKKRTISTLKALFGSKKGKRHHSSKSSRSASPSPEQSGANTPASVESFRPIPRTPPPARVGPPPSPPVPTQPVAPVAPEPAGPVRLVPCAVCGRTFVPESLAKHVKICEKTAAKRRKTFDSSRQRREGTDLEQFLPKNFMLPENSPFLEKSPPNTAKVAPKPKPQTVRTTVMKPAAELQKCPHCHRAFGVRAFERHVEWCADKAKILPAAPAQPPQHIADAKQRLNARTKYKAPLARGRRSSQTRDKSSNSRSASVESSRGVSPPPPPREYGDGRRRTRASESMSSNDYHDEPSPHVPVIRNSRNSLNNSSGDANVKARQARLARDLSSSRTTKESDPPNAQQNNNDSNPQKTLGQNNNETNPKKTQGQSNNETNPKKPQGQSNNETNPKKTQGKIKREHNVKKEQQLKKLEEIANKYSERQAKAAEEKEKKRQEKTQIPVLKKVIKKKVKPKEEIIEPIEESEATKIPTKPATKFNTNKVPTTLPKAPETPQKETRVKEKNTKNKVKKVAVSLPKETSLSVDSLDDCVTVTANDKLCQTVGINTELLCAPCIIHENLDVKPIACKSKKKSAIVESIRISARKEKDIDSGKNIELLYKNSVISSSTNIETTTSSVSNFSKSNQYGSESSRNMQKLKNVESTESYNNSPKINVPESVPLDSPVALDSDHNIEEVIDLSGEHFDQDSLGPDDNGDNLDNSDENNYAEDDENNEPGRRHGSGDTYTKFTENPADLDEFMNLTDKIISSQSQKELDLEKHIENLHTPRTISLETINTRMTDSVDETENKKQFSDTLEDLKLDLKELLHVAGDTLDNSAKLAENVDDTQEKSDVSAMEHITVYGLKHYERKNTSVEIDDEPKLKLPSITETNRPEAKVACTKKKMQKIYKSNRKYITFRERSRDHADSRTFIVGEDVPDSDEQSITTEAPPLKLPRIEWRGYKVIGMPAWSLQPDPNAPDSYLLDTLTAGSAPVSSPRPILFQNTWCKRLDDNYDPFVSAARQMKELLSSDTNIPKKMLNSSKDLTRTLPILRPAKDKTPLSQLRTENSKMIKDSLNKTYQKTPTLQRMKSFGSTNNDNNTTSSFGGRCSSFRLNRNEKKPTPKLNTTFTKSSKENISTVDKTNFNRNSSLNRSFSSYTASSYSTPKPKDKIPKIATSMYHSFQRTTIKQPVKLDKIKPDEDVKKTFVNLDAILADDTSSMTDSNYIDPRLINENDNLPINVNTILNNPDIISSMESLLTTENLPSKFDSFSKTHNYELNGNIEAHIKAEKDKVNNNTNPDSNKIDATPVDNLSAQYDKIMSSLEESIASKALAKDEEVFEEFDLEEFMTTFDEEIHKRRSENKRTCSSTTRVVRQSELIGSNKNSAFSSVSSTPKAINPNSNGLTPVTNPKSFNFSSNNIVSESLFPSSVKRSTSLLDSLQKKNIPRTESGKTRHKSDQLEQDIMRSLKDFDKFYESEKNDLNQSNKNIINYNMQVQNGTAKKDSRDKTQRRSGKSESNSNGNYTPNGKSSNDSAYSSLNRISPSKLTVCPKEPNGPSSLERIPAGSDSSGSHKDEIRSMSSEEFLAMERSAELDEPLPPPERHTPYKEPDNQLHEKRVSSRASSRRSSTWRGAAELSSSSSEVSLHKAAPAPRLSRFCHECGSKFPDKAKFCIECGVKRLAV